MENPIIYYIVLGVILVVGTAIITSMVRRGREGHLPVNPYIEGLKSLVSGEKDVAYHELERAVRTGHAPADAYIKLGALLRDRGAASKALQIHQSLTVKTDLSKTEKVELFMNLAEDYARLGDSGRSVDVLSSAIRNLHIREPDVFITLGRHYHLTGATDKAYDAFREAKKLGGIGDRELALYLATAAESLADRGDLREARKLLQRAVRHDPKCATGLLLLGDIAERSDELDEAIDKWKKVATLSPELADVALQKLESTLYERGRFGDIERIYNEVREERVGDEAATLGLSAFYKKQGRGEEAIQLLEDFVAVHPDSVRASLLLTSFYCKFRDAETLEQFLDRSFKESIRTQRFACSSCGFQSDLMRWNCPRCNRFDTFSTNHGV